MEDVLSKDGEDSADNEGQGKRKAMPFTSTMDVALATAYTTEKNILDGTVRTQGVPSRQQKLTAWERIRDCVNAFSGESNMKTVQQCKDRHRNLIQAVRFKRNVGVIERHLPMVNDNQTQDMIDTSSFHIKDKQLDETTNNDQHHQQRLPDNSQANGLPSTSTLPVAPPKRPTATKRHASAPLESTDDYHKRKLAILIKEHIVRVEMMKVQTEYYRAKTEWLKNDTYKQKQQQQQQVNVLPIHLPSQMQQPHHSGNT